MTQSYWINDYYVDLSRNHICFNGDEKQVPKKELAVLTLLAKNTGKVVSHDALMEQVWGDSVVSPNTLQRYIAQLRKAFGDDSKKQSIIKTYPKVGYSLEATVKWETESVNSNFKISNRKNYYLVLAILLLLLLGTYIGFKTPDKPTILLNSLSPITATDTDEVNPRYSPDGKFIVYRRYSKSHGAHLWAKNLSTNEEIKLTTESAKYGSYNWSHDSRHLAFSVMVLQSGREKPCWQIQTLDFTKALKSPQQTIKRSSCMDDRMAVARWLTNDNIAVLVKSNGKNHSLKSYNLTTNQLSEIYSPENRDLYSFDFSMKLKVFAVASRDDKNRHVIEKIDLNGKVLSTATITLKRENSAHEYYNVYFEPNGHYLLTSTALGLFQLFFDGTLQKINTFGYTNLAGPILHPNGKKLVAVQESIDQDIAVLNVSNTSKLDDSLIGNSKRIAKSNELDAAGAFQPNGKLIAFASNRSGKKQIWLYDGETAQQLSYFKNGLQTVDFAWSPSGKQLAAVSNDTLMLISLNGKIQSFTSSLLISKIMQWKTEDEIIVVANQDNVNSAFSLIFDKETQVIKQQRNLNVINIEWMQYIDNETFIYLDSERKTWLNTSSTQPAIHIELLMEKIGSKRLVVDEKVLYGINHQKQLWRYDIQSKIFKTIKQLPSTALYISDYNQDKALVTQSLRHNKEIVELSH